MCSEELKSIESGGKVCVESEISNKAEIFAQQVFETDGAPIEVVFLIGGKHSIETMPALILQIIHAIVYLLGRLQTPAQ
jgi:hypothetical protein